MADARRPPRNTFDFPLHPAVARARDTARAALAAAGAAPDAGQLGYDS